MDFFIGELRLFPFDYAPSDWALCNGAILQIRQNTALYALIGNRFGGDGVTTFALPDLRGRTAFNEGYVVGGNPANYTVGAKGGTETVTLNVTQIPSHTHQVAVTNVTGIDTIKPANFLASPQNLSVYYSASAPTSTLIPDTMSTVGASASHPNIQPFLVLNYCIAIRGNFPPRP